MPPTSSGGQVPEPDWKSELKRILAQMESKKQAPTKDSVLLELDKVFKPEALPKSSEEHPVNDFISFIESYIIPRKNRKREVQKLEQTKKLLLICFKLISTKRLMQWEQHSIKAKAELGLKAEGKLPFSDVNLKMLERFRDFVYTYPYTSMKDGKEIVRHYKINYIDKIVKGLKQVINAAIEAGHVQPFRWTSIKSEDRQVDSVLPTSRKSNS